MQLAAQNEFDTGIIVSSDGDFAPPVTMVKDIYGKPTEVIYFPNTKPLIMEGIAIMREFRRSFLREHDR
ncbi:MAG: NYN domain-containing protein [Chloroflexi bacterium]|nr:NYN domain-containing protein [Chloroflexota bacterium]